MSNRPTNFPAQTRSSTNDKNYYKMCTLKNIPITSKLFSLLFEKKKGSCSKVGYFSVLFFFFYIVARYFPISAWFSINFVEELLDGCCKIDPLTISMLNGVEERATTVLIISESLLEQVKNHPVDSQSSRCTTGKRLAREFLLCLGFSYSQVISHESLLCEV